MSFRTLAAGGAFQGEVPVIATHQEDPSELFRAALRRGFTPIWTSELADAMAGRRGLPSQPVCFIFDDGDPAWYTTTHAAVTTYKVKANMAVVSDYLDGVTGLNGISNYPGLTWTQARTMHATGFYEWINHTKDHTTSIGVNSTARRFSLQTCNDRIGAELGVQPPRAVVYPQSAYTDGVVDDVRALGFDLGFTYAASLRSVALPGAAQYVLDRSDVGSLMLWAKQRTIHECQHDMTGGRNAANVLGYWTMPAGGSFANNGKGLLLAASGGPAARSFITTDYFHVQANRVYSRCVVATTGRTVGTARISVCQYDAAKTALATIDIASITTDQSVTYDADYTLDPACRFVRLEIATDATYNGNVQASEWLVKTTA